MSDDYPTYPVDPYNLPVPRLQLVWQHTLTPYRLGCYQHLVYRHHLGHVVFVPMGFTEKTGENLTEDLLCSDGTIYTPFRDGCHIRKNMEHLNLLGWVIIDNNLDDSSDLYVGELVGWERMNCLQATDANAVRRPRGAIPTKHKEENGG